MGDDDDDDFYFHTYIHIVAVGVAESNILEEYERRFWGWPLSKENNGSSNVQLTVSISVYTLSLFLEGFS